MVTLAYPDFNDAAKQRVVKDAYLRGLHPDMRLQLKAMEKFQTISVKDLVSETTRLEVAGVRSGMGAARPKEHINVIEPGSSSSVAEASGSIFNEQIIQQISEAVAAQLNKESVSPERFCAACGEKGHDYWDRRCKKYL